MNSFEKIRIIRQLSKQTQTEFGESLGLSKATISNFETGRVPIPQYVIILLKLLYNIDPDWLSDDSQSDFEKRYFDKNKNNDNALQATLIEKFKKLTEPHKKYLIRCIEELILLQKMESEFEENDENSEIDSDNNSEII